jgi:hypothetical protein
LEAPRNPNVGQSGQAAAPVAAGYSSMGAGYSAGITPAGEEAGDPARRHGVALATYLLMMGNSRLQSQSMKMVC